MAVTQNLTLTQQSQSLSGNSSQVRLLWTSTQTGGSYNLTRRTAYLYYSVNGQPETAVQLSYTLPLQTTQVIYDQVLTVPHRADGTALLSVRTWMDTNISAGVVTLTKSLTPTPIARQSTVTAPKTGIGSVATITVDRRNDAYTHSLRFAFGELSGYLTAEGAITDTEQKLTAVTVPFAIPDSFYGQMPNAPEAACRLYCTTYQGTTKIGQTVSSQFTVFAPVSECRPLVSGQTEDVNPVTTAVTGDSRVLIRYLSDAVVTVSAQARQGASIRRLFVDGKEAENGTMQLPGITVPPGQYQALDSRGYTGVSAWEGDWVPYVRLTSAPTAVRTDPTSGNACLTFSGVCYEGSLNPNAQTPNTLTLSYSVDGGDFVQVTEYTVSDGRYTASVIVPDLRYDRVHSLTARVSDRLMTVDKVLTVKKGTPVFDWGENDFRFHVPVQIEGALTVNALTIGGKSLLDAVYPVGSVYMSLSSQTPDSLFGGTWSRLQDRFLLAAGEAYPAGSTGGEKTHTLTVNEMPAHSHTVPGRVNGAAGAGTGAWDYSGNWPVEANGASAVTGGSAPHNNMPPYMAVYMWQRTA